MELQVNQILPSVTGYITDSRFLHGTINDFEINLGYSYGRLKNGFYIAHLLQFPEVDGFETAGYSITPKHRHKAPEDLDLKKLRIMARNAMLSIGLRNLVKVFPVIGHNPSIGLDEQYPYGKGGIPQWNLTKGLPMRVFKKIEANHTGNILLYS